jgi:pimeloyl-ACP methyl ester carboxylesterase
VTDDLLAFDDGGSGTAVVLIHGLTFSRRSWDPIAKRLAEQYRVIALDLPGHGESLGSAADPQTVATRIAATLRSAGVEKPTVVGHSAGAIHATATAARMRTAGVINVDQPLLVAPFTGFLQQMAPALRGPEFATAFAPFEESIGVHKLPEPERRRLQSTRTVTQDLVLDHWTMPMTTPADQAQAQLDQMLDQVDAAYLYLAGDDPPAPVEEHLRAHVPQLEVVVWPGTGHLPQHADPEAFVRLVTDFVARASSH